MVVYKLVGPFVDCKDAVEVQPMGSMFGHHSQAADSFVVRSYLDIDDDVAVVGHLSDAIAIVSLKSAFVQLDLVVAVFVLVLLAHPCVVRELGELNKIVVAADLKPMFVAVVAICQQIKTYKKFEEKHEYVTRYIENVFVFN